MHSWAGGWSDGATAAAAAAEEPHGSQRRPSRRLLMLLSHEAGVAAAGRDIEMVNVPNPVARQRGLLDDGGIGSGKTSTTNETVKLLQSLLNNDNKLPV